MGNKREILYVISQTIQSYYKWEEDLNNINNDDYLSSICALCKQEVFKKEIALKHCLDHMKEFEKLFDEVQNETDSK